MIRTEDRGSPLRALLLYDIEGWAWWHRARNVQKHAPPDLVVEIARLGDDFDDSVYDFVVIFEGMFFDAVAHVSRSKLVVGCSCPKLLKDLLIILEQHCPAAAFVNNAEMAEVVSSRYRCYCCPNGVDEELFVPATTLPPREQAVWVGSSHSFADKGLKILKEACERAMIPLLLVDKAEAIQTGGLLSHEELRDTVYHQATLYLCASEAEGTPNPALEALACGVPVVSTRVGNMPEIIENRVNGYLVDREPQAIERAIEDARKANLEEMSKAARSRILAGWTWRHQAQRYAAMFRDLKEAPS